MTMGASLLIVFFVLNLTLAYSGRLILLHQKSNERRILVQNDIEIIKGTRSCTYWTGIRVHTLEGEGHRWTIKNCPLVVAPGQTLMTGSGIIID